MLMSLTQTAMVQMAWMQTLMVLLLLPAVVRTAMTEMLPCILLRMSLKEIPKTCDGLEDPDVDADGVSSERDCDDLNASVYPGAAELMGDGLDNNCDGRIDELYLDRDGDGFGAMDEGGTDCDDYNAEAYPNAEEILDDGIDQDCDGVDDVEVLGVYRDLLRVHDKLSQVSCIVIEDYKTVDCFEQHTLRTVMRRTFEFEGRLKDIAFSWLRTSGCALSDRGELTCWNDSSSDSNSWPIYFSQDSYEEATSLIRGQSGAICVAGRDDVSSVPENYRQVPGTIEN